MKIRGLIEEAMMQWRIVVTLVAIAAGIGVYSYLTMQRQEFPDFTIRQGLVVGVMPGATTEQIEDKLARPVEDYLFTFNEVDKTKTYSVSKDGQVVVYVELKKSISGPDAPAFWAKLRLGLQELKAQKLPPQVLALVGNNDFGDTSALLFTISAEGRSPRDLKKYVESLEEHLRRIDATTKLRVFGEQQETIRVSISRDRMTHYGIRPATVWAALQGLQATPATARLDQNELERPIHVNPTLNTEAELADTILLSLPTGQNIRLRDVADDIKREYGHDDAYVRYNGKTALVLSIEMQSGNDITHFGDQVDQALAETKAELPAEVTIARVADQPKVVSTSVNHFMRDFLLAIAAVILVTILLLPIRVASVAAVTIPISIAITLAILNLMGVQLQTVSLAGLVVVLGMVVDNAIVVIDDHIDKLDRGMMPWTAACESASELAVSVFTATIAIILVYASLPILVTGQAGDFLRSLPVTIAVALAVSMLVALLLVPAMNAHLIQKGLHKQHGKRSMLDLIQGAFDSALEAAFRLPWLTVAAGLLSVAAAIFIALHIPIQMFPKIDRNQFAVEVYLPNGRSLEQTDAVIRRLESDLMADRRVTDVTSFIGQSSPRFHTVYAPHMPARNFGQLLVNTVSNEATIAVLHEDRLRYAGDFPEGWVRWKQLEFQFGFPVEIRLSGSDIDTLKQASAQIEAKARSIPGVTWVHNDYEDAIQSIDILADRDESARLGVPPALLQASVAMGTQGYPAATIWEGDYPVRVLVEDSPGKIATVDGLKQEYVSSYSGAAAVPLAQVAVVKPAWHEGAIVRRNGVRTLTVLVDLGPYTLGSSVQKQMEDYIAGLKVPGIRVEYGGEKELSAEVMTPMSISLLIGIGFIFLVILFQFQRFKKALVVMAAMPLSLFGALFGLLVAGYPFGVTAFVGIIGLMGIVVRNGIILVSYAEELRREHGLRAMEAGLAAGKRRMRPIYLTAMAAAIGVVPLILSRSSLWGPLGTVVCSGLLFGMVLTLFVLPVVYGLVMRSEDEPRQGSPAAPTLAGVLLLCLLLPVVAHAQQAPLTLAECKKMALEHNAATQEAALDIRAAQQERAVAATKRTPQISSSVLGYAAPTSLVSMMAQSGKTGFAGQGSLEQVSAIQPLYTGGRIENGNRLAALGVEVARERQEMARRDVLAQTEENYWRLVALAEKLRTIQAYQELLAQLEKQVSDALASGLITRNDLLKVQLKRSEAALDRQRLESGIHLASRDLRHHIGLPDEDSIALADGLDKPLDPASLEMESQQRGSERVELRLLEKAVRAEDLQIALKHGEMMPTVAVGGTFYRYDFAGLPGSTNVAAFGTADIPISKIREIRHAVQAERERKQIAELKLNDTRELIGIEVLKTWSDLQDAWLATKVAVEEIAQSDVNVREETDKQANGMATYSDVLEAQVLRHQAQDRMMDARSDYWIKRSAYLRSIGSREENW